MREVTSKSADVLLEPGFRTIDNSPDFAVHEALYHHADGTENQKLACRSLDGQIAKAN